MTPNVAFNSIEDFKNQWQSMIQGVQVDLRPQTQNPGSPQGVHPAITSLSDDYRNLAACIFDAIPSGTTRDLVLKDLITNGSIAVGGVYRKSFAKAA